MEIQYLKQFLRYILTTTGKLIAFRLICPMASTVGILSNFPGYWDNPLNQRDFFKALGKKFQVETVKDWGKVTIRDVKSFGGSGFYF